MHAPTSFPHRRRNFLEALFVVGVLTCSSSGATAAPEDDVRATFDQFVKAHNGHDISAVCELLLDSANFLWVTRGALSPDMVRQGGFR